MKSLKNKKTSGKESITNKMLKYCSETIPHKLHYFLSKTLDLGYYPETWNNGFTFLTYKLGAKENPSNYCGITLTNCFRKIIQ